MESKTSVEGRDWLFCCHVCWILRQNTIRKRLCCAKYWIVFNNFLHWIRPISFLKLESGEEFKWPGCKLFYTRLLLTSSHHRFLWQTWSPSVHWASPNGLMPPAAVSVARHSLLPDSAGKSKNIISIAKHKVLIPLTVSNTTRRWMIHCTISFCSDLAQNAQRFDNDMTNGLFVS